MYTYMCTYMHTHMHTYCKIHIYIYIWYPPKDPCFSSLFSSFHMPTSFQDQSSTRTRLLVTAPTPPSAHMSRIISSPPQTDHIETQCGPIFQYDLGEVHIEILGHIEFQYGGSKVQDPRLHGALGEESWIMDLGSSILKFNMASIFQYSTP